MVNLPETVKIVLLATLQGVAEFLPISSSGHLVVLEELLGKVGESNEMTIVLHFGTLLSILAYYWRRILKMLTSDRRVIWLVFVGSIPAAFAGIVIKKKFDWLLDNALLAGCMFPITAIMLLGLQRHSISEGTNYVKMPVWKAFVIGLSQAFAILPGISRSGSTIATGVLLGLHRESAATFSFLLAIPAIGGAMLLQIIGAEGFSMPVSQALLGIGISFVVGLVSLAVLIRMLGAGKLHWFAAWLFPLGAAVIIWQCLAL